MCILPLLALLGSMDQAPPLSITEGVVRVEILSPSLVRLEQKGPRGFEDRPTFTVVNRNFAESDPLLNGLHGFHGYDVQRQQTQTTVRTGYMTVVIPSEATSLSQVDVKDASGNLVYKFDGRVPKNGFLPAPGHVPPAWTLSDSPRLVPPAWGATPAIGAVEPALIPTSGWDDRNDAPDVYVFVPGQGGYFQLKSDFLTLTGPVPKPPLYVLGFIDSRYHPYTEKEALDSIDTYRKKGIPLDTFVVDTDWRINGSAGYDVETRDFPDMPRFIKEAHDRHAHLMFNDHPDPKAPGAMDPKELAFRWAGLTKLLNWGMDIWWYDRNWSTSLHQPMPGISKEVWGQRLYHDITERDRPTERPWIMSNAEGIDNGRPHYAPSPAGHRFPMWWTGDTGSQFSFLKLGVQNGVDRGVLALEPYTHEDLGGHTGPTPSPELYVRYLEFGCLSPITRVHCTLGQDRHPWAFGAQAEQIVTDYIKLRYRLLPMLYSAAQRTYDDGTPILRRCDLEWPKYAEAAANDQYLLGDDILVAPILEALKGEIKPIPSTMLQTAEGKPGLKAEYFDNAELNGEPKMVRTDANIDFDWSGGPPLAGVPQDNFSVRWTGQLGPIATGGKYTISTKNDDGVRVYLDDKLIVDDWKPEDSAVNQVELELAAGSTHSLRVEYMQLTGNALCALGWSRPPPIKNDTRTHRHVWIPPGTWQDVWSGEIVTGPTLIGTSAALSQTPMWVRQGGIVLTGPDLQYTGEKPMNPITVEAYAGGTGTTNRSLCEDDGISTSYINGAVGRTKFKLTNTPVGAKLSIGPLVGRFANMRDRRTWIVRMHLPPGRKVANLLVDGKPVKQVYLPRADIQIPFSGVVGAEESGTLEVRLPTSSIYEAHSVDVKYDLQSNR